MTERPARASRFVSALAWVAAIAATGWAGDARASDWRAFSHTVEVSDEAFDAASLVYEIDGRPLMTATCTDRPGTSGALLSIVLDGRLVRGVRALGVTVDGVPHTFAAAGAGRPEFAVPLDSLMWIGLRNGDRATLTLDGRVIGTAGLDGSATAVGAFLRDCTALRSPSGAPSRLRLDRA